MKRIFFLHSLVCTSVLLFASYYFLLGVSCVDYLYSLCVATLILFIWILISWQYVCGLFLNLYTIFIVSTAAFNCGQVFLEVFGLNSRGLLSGKFEANVLFETVLFVLLGLSAVHLGALLRVSQNTDSLLGEEAKAENPRLYQFGTLLLLFSVVPTMIIIKQMFDIVLKSGYFALYTRDDQIGLDNLLALMSNFFVPGILFTLAGSKSKPSAIRWTQIGIGLYGGMLILLGRRGDGAEAILAYLIVFQYCIRSLNRKVLLSGVALMLVVVFPLIATIRNTDLAKRGDVNVMMNAYDSLNNPAALVIAEMGGSMQAISHTLVQVPKFRDYDWGASYLYSFFSIFPNFFWRIHPSVARGSPSVWLVKTVEPDIAALGGGLGYSYIAEAYLNFGWWGGALMLMFIGYAISSLVCWSQGSGNTLKIAAAATFFTSLVGFARADSQSVMRPLFWYSLLPYFAVKWWQTRVT